MSKTIIFHYSKLNLGGAEKSNIRLMNYLAKRGWRVELVLNYGYGLLENSLDPSIKIVYLESKTYISRNFRERKFIKKYFGIILDIIPFIFSRIVRILIKYSYRSKKYDFAAVGFQGLDVGFIAKRINAKIKLHWIRTDLLYCDPSGRVKNNIEKYSQFIDYYLCVSRTSYNSFITLFPHLAYKTKLFYNILNSSEMIEKAEMEDDPYQGFDFENSIKILTVCRIQDRAKGVFRMYSVYKKLIFEGFKIKWVIIGEGEDKESLEKMVINEEHDNGFILTGLKENPFPYYKYADICATLSYYEGLCGAVNEAKVLGKCVIATEFSGIHEQLTNMVNGIIVENNEEAIFVGMKLLLTDTILRKKLSNNFLPNSIINDNLKIHILEELLKR